MAGPTTKKKFRSQEWFDNPDNPGMTALYLERYLNYGLTREELQSGKPLIGIAQTGSDLSPCNRHHLELAKRVRAGIEAAGGVPFEFPCHPIQETGKRPTAALDRNLAYLSLVEVLYGYPLDGVVLTIGCDKTTPALLMAAATVNIPAIALSVGPMLNGWHKGKRTGSGTIVWESRQRLSTGEIDYDEFMDIVASSAPSVGFCNTMGTATTMNSLAEALGMQLPGSAAIPAPYRERGQIAYETGQRIVDMVHEDLKPSDIMTREAFENAIVVNSAIGGSTNAPIHLNAIARHLGVKLDNDDWQAIGHHDSAARQPAAGGRVSRRGLSPRRRRAGGGQRTDAGQAAAAPRRADRQRPHDRRELQAVANEDRDVIRTVAEPLKADAGFINLKGNLFDSAIMKTERDLRRVPRSLSVQSRRSGSVRGQGCRVRRAGRLSRPHRRSGGRHRRAHHPVHARRRPVGYPGGAEVVNMQPPAYLIKRGIHALPCVGDGRQSGTSGSPSILNASPEAAAGGGLALLKTGDRVRIDLRKGTANILIADEELAARRAALNGHGGYHYPKHQTPWQEIQRAMVDQFSEGMVLKPAVKYRDVAHTSGVPRDNH